MGMVVLVTRPREQAGQLVSELESLGATVHAIPAIETEPFPEPAGLKEALRNITEYDHLVFTSINGVYFFLRHLEKIGLSPVLLPSALCVGPSTAEAWRKAGGVVGAVPDKYTAGGLLGTLGDDLSGVSLLLLRPEHVKTDLGTLLRERGVKTDEIVLYRTLIREESAKELTDLLKKIEPDAVFFASPSAVEGILSMIGDSESFRNLLAVCIGPVTARAASDAGLKRVVFPEDYTVEGMIGLLLAATVEMKDRR
jgi:uroporphyrinogen III methyltransferase/synthase